MKQRLLFAGVGGQGVLTGAKILAQAMLGQRLHVFMSEVHGMAQRGGSVVCTVCIGDVHSPLIADGAADAIISMEPVEALRRIHKLRSNGIVLTDINPVIPPNVSMGYHEYPSLDDVFTELEERGTLVTIDALQRARDAGHAITKNIVMLGALAGLDVLPVDRDAVMAAVREAVPDSYVEMNEKAFRYGYEAVRD
jgi:indolepyruvate ferredoxin oxidoreductase beta subunit